MPAQEFHELNQLRRHDWPYEMTATSTHDTKLGEDVRARIDVLSELPDEWGREVSRWMRSARTARSIVDGDPAPDRNEEYRFYQALVGAWPPAGGATAEFVERMQAYMNKSVKEAKLHSSWINPHEGYERAVGRYVERVLTGPESPRVLPLFLPFAQRVARAGLVNSLSQVTLKIASPGVPDFYQGSELWDLTLVDPDNRRPVDFERRKMELDSVDAVLGLAPDARAAALAGLLASWEDGRIKLLVTAAGLRLRSAHPEIFVEGDYLPLETETTIPAKIVAFARTTPGQAAIVVAPHLAARAIDADHPAPLGDLWKTSRVQLPPALAGLTYRDAFTGAELKPVTAGDNAWIFVGQALKTLPAALLVAE